MRFLSSSCTLIHFITTTTFRAAARASDKLHISKERRLMKTRIIRRRTPSPQLLIRKRLRTHDRPEEIHPPLRALRLPLIDIEQPQRNLHFRRPGLAGLVERRARGDAVVEGCREVGRVEGVVFRGVEDEGLEELED